MNTTDGKDEEKEKETRKGTEQKNLDNAEAEEMKGSNKEE